MSDGLPLNESSNLLLRQVQDYIYKINFSNIIDKMVKHQGWRRKHAEKISDMYKNYLFLCRKYGDKHQLPPSEEIDEFWHNHILDTKKYHEDCMNIFGKYYHHYPYFGIDDVSSMNDLSKAFKTTQDLYRKEFNEKIKVVRGRFAVLKMYLFRIMKDFF